LKETRALPIRPINFSDPADVARHDRMVALVEKSFYEFLCVLRISAVKEGFFQCSAGDLNRQ
jgi:hypothetical protein